MVVQVLMVDEDEMVGWMVVKPELVDGIVVMLGRMEVMGVVLEMELGGSSAVVTLLQDLQHIRW